ncbi:STAS/SEC14 domain-containing protein [Psychrobium sp. 1_MG-2023]|uniref:STAS/SEC14 domain-containing protein n=1 Tax=Psychrobium sp. 1_MG-2023 TaxID=3062624 RepID=UPI000C340F7C|nr:STAS/SEC14 domain-containing protein [Psychrobium sp. 1_MG-2023]MDP2562669.1 STAS/SEC14 domain-containing protein [Psychrobium sp. 1_MG-2023]PKF53803.1 STAS/SEC14 domain-containing protein [Alteromonadales bacterium alter-6D02]
MLADDIGEITVNEGTEIDVAMVEEIHMLMLSVFNDKFSLLINKVNSYSTHFDALSLFGQIDEVNKIAVYAPSKMAKFSADFSAAIPSSSALNIQVFIERDEALDWIKAAIN